MVMPFNEGSLPFRNLGVPMCSKRLTNDDCSGLIEVMNRRLGDWKNKSLSFAGRLYLIASILSSF